MKCSNGILCLLRLLAVRSLLLCYAVCGSSVGFCVFSLSRKLESLSFTCWLPLNEIRFTGFTIDSEYQIRRNPCGSVGDETCEYTREGVIPLVWIPYCAVLTLST